MATVAPDSANDRTVAAPMPLLPPVTTAILLVRSITCSSSHDQPERLAIALDVSSGRAREMRADHQHRGGRQLAKHRPARRLAPRRIAVRRRGPLGMADLHGM